jgi:SAM-dependent methyltransferase
VSVAKKRQSDPTQKRGQTNGRRSGNEQASGRKGAKDKRRTGKKGGKRSRPRLTAKNADKHLLYQQSVQDPASEVKFVARVFKKLRGRRAESLREDFCGTALFCAEWVKSGKQKPRTATGVDIDAEVLAWGREHNLKPLGERARRIRLLQQDVRDPCPEKYDIVAAFNFSYWIFETRDGLRRYFETVLRSLEPDGLFFVDAYGGWEAFQPMEESRACKGFTYVWDQDEVDPITGHVTNHIHFKFKDGSKLKRAFTYEWRMWSLPELRELLLEAGFSTVTVYWDEADDDDETRYRPHERAENHPGWLAYLVANR